MRNRDQFLGALFRGLFAQLRDTEFGDHVVDVVLAGGHVGAGCKRRHDAGNNNRRQTRAVSLAC